MDTKNIDAEELSKLFSYKPNTSLSEAIILSALSINKKNKFLSIKEYRDSAFSVLWENQFHHGDHWLAQYRSELNQGVGRLANRVFQSPNNEGYNYKLKAKGISNEDKAIIERLKNILKEIEVGKAFSEDDNDEEYQKKVSWVTPKRTKNGIVTKKKEKESSKTSSIPRDAGIAKTALIDAEYKCQIDSNHKTFISPKTNKNYVEAHHLIPMEYYDDFKNCIDVEANIVALCPNCHREVHFSSIKNKEKLLKTLMTDQRKKLLTDKGIPVTEKELLSLYK